MKIKLKSLCYLLIPLSLLIAISCYIAFLYPNIHTVIPGKIYRSAELSPSQLSVLSNKDHLNTIINLRGQQPNQSWYQQEVRFSNKHHITHVDLHLKAKNYQAPAKLNQLIDLLIHAKKPILVHCWRGADRTGLASAFALILLAHPTIQQIKAQYSPLKLALSPISTAKCTLPLYFHWLKQHRQSSSARALIQWAKQLRAGINYPL